MRRMLIAAAGALLLLPLTACEKTWNQGHDTPVASALPGIAHPVGPVPGPRDVAVQPHNPYEGDPQAQRAGRHLFLQFNCYGCHGGRGGGGMGPSLRDEDWMYGKEPADVFDSIAEGRANGMPAWGTRIPQQQIWQLVSYVESFNTPDEPDKP